MRTKVILPEHLIALFLRTGREKEKRKIQMLLEQAEIDLEKLDYILDKYKLREKFKGSSYGG